MFKCNGEKSYKKFDKEGKGFCPFYFGWGCEKCFYYKKNKVGEKL